MHSLRPFASVLLLNITANVVNNILLHHVPLSSFLRPLEKSIYSPKRPVPAGRGDKKDGACPLEESEILLVKSSQKTGEPSLFWALCRTFGPYFLVSTVYKIVHDILMFVGPAILK